MHQSRKWNAKAYKPDTAPLPSKRRSVKGQARRAACRVKKIGFQAYARTFRFVLPRPLHRPPFGRGSGCALPPMTGESCCFPDHREEVSPNGAINGAQKMEDAEKANYAIRLIEGRHLTASNKRHISALLERGWWSGHSRHIQYEIARLTDDTYRVIITQRERDDMKRVQTRTMHVTILASPRMIKRRR